MGLIYKQAFKGTVYTYIGVALGFLTSAFLLPQLLSSEEVGLLKVLLSFAIIFVQFASLGLNSVTIRMFSYFRDKNKDHNGYLFVLLAFSLVGFLLSILVYYGIKPYLIEKSIEKSALFADYIYYLVPIIFFQLFFGVLDTYYTVLFNSVRGTFLKDVVQRVLIIVAILLYYFELLTFKQFVFAYFLSVFVKTFLIVISLIRERQFNLKYNIGYITKPLAHSMISVGVFGLLNNFTGVVILNIDSIMVNTMIGLEFTGIYAITFFFGTLIKIPARSLIKISNVVVADAWKDNDIPLIRSIYSKSCITQTIMGLLLYVGLIVNLDNVMRILPPEYESGRYVVALIALANLFDMVAGVGRSVLGTSKQYKVQTLFMVFLMAFVVVTNYLFIPKWGIIGAALGSATSLFLFNLMRFIYLWKKHNMQPYSFKYLVIFLLALVAFGAVYFIPYLNHIVLDIFVRGSIVTLVFCLPIYFLKYSTDINQIVDRLIGKILQR